MKKILMPLFLLLAEGAEDRRIPVGGQAVIEGVLMKGPAQWGLSVRKPDGMIETETWSNRPWTSAMPWKLPVIRGVVTMIEMMTVGFRALDRSAQIAVGEEEKITAKEMFITAAVAILAVVGLFIALPLWLSDLAVRAWGIGPLGKNILEGCARGIVFIAYVAGIGMWSEIRRVFSYHGAEHKTINAYEDGAELTPEAVERYSTAHTRCGTGFLLVVVVIFVLLTTLLGPMSLPLRLLSRLLLLPVVSGIAYEWIKFSARHYKTSALIRALAAPGLALQRLTTRTPDRGMLEVAIHALQAVLASQKPVADETPVSEAISA